MSINSLINAIGKSERAPCDKFSCSARPACADALLACTAFRHYVGTGVSMSPTIVFPTYITKQNQPVETDAIRPTRAIFESMCAVDSASPLPADPLPRRKRHSHVPSFGELQAAWS